MLVLQSHSDLGAIGKQLGLAKTDNDSVLKELQSHEQTLFFRELACDSAALASDADMTANAGKGFIYVTPKLGDTNFQKNARGELEVSFTTDGDQIKVTGWTVKLPPVRKAGSPDPTRKGSIQVVKEIAKPEEQTITDSGGTRKVEIGRTHV